MRVTARELYELLSAEFVLRGIGSDDFSKLEELYTWASIGEEAKSEYKKIEKLRAENKKLRELMEKIGGEYPLPGCDANYLAKQCLEELEE